MEWSRPVPVVIWLVLVYSYAGVESQGVISGAVYNFAHVTGCWTTCALYQLQAAPALCSSGFYEGRFIEQCSNCVLWRCPCSSTSNWAECAHHTKFQWGCPSAYPYLAYRTRECIPCHSSCAECRGPLTTDCTTCEPGKVLVGTRCADQKFVFGAQVCQASKCTHAVAEVGACPTGYSEFRRTLSCSAGCLSYYCPACTDWGSCARRDNVFRGCSKLWPTASYQVKECAACNITTCPTCQSGSDCYLCPATTHYLQGSKCVTSCSTGYARISSAPTDRVCQQDTVDHCNASNPCLNNGTCVNYYQRTECVCAPGFNGTICAINDDDCVGNRCVQGSCVDGITAYTCTCSAGFAGTYCSIDINECGSTPCRNGAACTNSYGSFACTCVAGYTGTLCQTDIDDCSPTPCAYGPCVDLLNDYTCHCPLSFTGKNCSVNIDECASSPCQSGGTCVDYIGRYACSCPWGYTGRRCETDIDSCLSSPCQAGGTCVDAVPGFYCHCPTGITGFTCQGDIDECLAKPCLNNGLCLNSIGAFTCNCKLGYTGATCASDVDECLSSPCRNGGTCADLVGGFHCACPSGYSGEMCHVNVDDCSPSPCLNQGSCTDLVNGFQCTCATGFTGSTCDTDIDDCAKSAGCSGHGQCVDGVNAITCICDTGFTGALCSINVDDCLSKPCQNGGLCSDGVNNYTCTCVAGYTGKVCTTNLDACATQTCLNGGLCVDLAPPADGYVCHCLPGYTGGNCETNIDDCFTSPCRNSGTCLDGIDRFTCSCAQGFYGQVCEFASPTSAQPTTSAATTPTVAATTAQHTTPAATTSATTAPRTTPAATTSATTAPRTTPAATTLATTGPRTTPAATTSATTARRTTPAATTSATTAQQTTPAATMPATTATAQRTSPAGTTSPVVTTATEHSSKGNLGNQGSEPSSSFPKSTIIIAAAAGGAGLLLLVLVIVLGVSWHRRKNRSTDKFDVSPDSLFNRDRNGTLSSNWSASAAPCDANDMPAAGRVQSPGGDERRGSSNDYTSLKESSVTVGAVKVKYRSARPQVNTKPGMQFPEERRQMPLPSEPHASANALKPVSIISSTESESTYYQLRPAVSSERPLSKSGTAERKQGGRSSGLLAPGGAVSHGNAASTSATLPLRTVTPVSTLNTSESNYYQLRPAVSSEQLLSKSGTAERKQGGRSSGLLAPGRTVNRDNAASTSATVPLRTVTPVSTLNPSDSNYYQLKPNTSGGRVLPKRTHVRPKPASKVVQGENYYELEETEETGASNPGFNRSMNEQEEQPSDYVI